MAFSKSVGRLAASGTALGFVAIILWSTTVAFARSISERLGPLTAAACVYGVGALAALTRLTLSAGRRRSLAGLGRRYLVVCGLLFVTYMLVLFLSVGLADGRGQVLEVGLVNYLWPTLTILFSLLVLGKRASAFLIPGTALALGGVFLVLTQGQSVTWETFARNTASNPAAYGLGLCAAVSWALYSSLTRKWAGGASTGGVDVFLPATAVVMLVLSAFVDEPRAWGVAPVAEAVFLGGATYTAYGCWDAAMRRGDVFLVAAGSYLTPLLSTLVTVVYLSVPTGPRLWIGCVVLVAGSFMSWRSVSDRGSSS